MAFSSTCIGIVFGGESKEHQVSINSAITVFNALQRGVNARKFTVEPIYIDQSGRWWGPFVGKKILSEGKPLNNIEITKENISSGFTSLPDGCEKIQVWFPVLHGPNGEDGTIQGLFKLMKKPFVGSGVLGSALSMDKLAMKAAFANAGLPQVSYLAIHANELLNEIGIKDTIQKVEKSLGYPCFIKPANLGSSVGITKANERIDLRNGLDKAIQFDQRIVVEKACNGRELECAILGNDEIQSSVVGEIRFSSEWYDYETKYSSNSSKVLIPAPIPKEVSDQVKILALQACKAVCAFGMARVDFFYEEKTNGLLINEINTLPGFTSQSMYPMLWEATGISLEKLVGLLVDMARA